LEKLLTEAQRTGLNFELMIEEEGESTLRVHLGGKRREIPELFDVVGSSTRASQIKQVGMLGEDEIADANADGAANKFGAGTLSPRRRAKGCHSKRNVKWLTLLYLISFATVAPPSAKIAQLGSDVRQRGSRAVTRMF
jgi:hypothetical protein